MSAMVSRRTFLQGMAATIAAIALPKDLQAAKAIVENIEREIERSPETLERAMGDRMLVMTAGVREYRLPVCDITITMDTGYVDPICMVVDGSYQVVAARGAAQQYSLEVNAPYSAGIELFNTNVSRIDTIRFVDHGFTVFTARGAYPVSHSSYGYGDIQRSSIEFVMKEIAYES